MSEKELLPPDLEYYMVVARTQNNPEILKAELLDLIKEIKAWNTRPDSKPYKYETPEEGWLAMDRCFDWPSYLKAFADARERKE